MKVLKVRRHEILETIGNTIGKVSNRIKCQERRKRKREKGGGQNVGKMECVLILRASERDFRLSSVK